MSSTELKLFDSSGKELGTKSVPESIFDREIVPGLLHQVVRWQRAKKRAGTHKVLTRAEVSGGGKKPFRQKGLGRARAGSNTSPVWVGGGVAHGPKPRSYDFHLNRKEKKCALGSAISARTKEGKCFAVADFGLSEIKTREAVKVLKALGVGQNNSALVALGEDEETVFKSLRNVANVKPILAKGLNVYDILNSEYLVVTEKALEQIETRFA